MGRIQSSVGLVTGIEIEDTVNQLMALAAQPRDRLSSRQKSAQATQAAISDLTALTLGVQLAARRLKTTSLFSSRSITSTSTSLTAAANGEVAPGQYQFTPLRQAQAAHQISSGIASLDQEFAAGTLSIRQGGQVDRGAALADLNGGEGVSRGKIRIADRAGNTAVIDLRYSLTIDDVLAAINESDEIDVTASAIGDRLVLTDESGGAGNLRVQEVSGGTTAADLGLAGINVAADSANGQTLTGLFSGQSLASLNDGNGVSLLAELPDLEFSFRDGTTLSLDLNPTGQSEPQTLGELVSRLNAAAPTRLAAAISSDGLRLELTDLTANTGGTFAVTNSLGSRVATELGLTTTAIGDSISGRRLAAGLKTTLLSTLGGGNGLGTLGNLQITDRSGTSATIDLAAAATLDDVIAAINQAAVGVRAEYNAARSGIALVDTTGQSTSNLIVASGDGTNTATKLGLEANVAADEVQGTALGRQTVSRSTLLADYNGGAGISLGSLRITDSQGQTRTLNLAALESETVGDVIDAINGLATGVEASINATGDGILLTDTAGGSGQLQVANVGSGRTAGDLHLAGTATGTTIDGTTNFAIEIEAGDTLADIADKINDLDIGIAASIFSESSGSLRHHLSLVSGVAGAAGELQIDGSDLGLSFSSLTQGQDALLQLGSGLGSALLSSPTSSFSGVVPGLDVTVSGNSTDPVTVGVAASSTTAANAIQTFVDQYNKLRDKLDTYTAFDATAGTKGTLFGTYEALRIDNDLASLLSGRFTSVGDIRSLGELGLSLTEDGHLSFDKAKFQTRYDADPDAVTTFFTDETSGFAAKADALLERLVGRDNSVLINRSEALGRQVEDLGNRLTAFNARLDRQRERLLNQFYNLELVISKLQNNLTALDNLQTIAPLGSTTG
ncbi:MAG: flagellar filament capping protein FliD [Pirellulaceae bacterium]|nr:flagellar filament capping protein FliD [Pirellulaceae bacterium]